MIEGLTPMIVVLNQNMNGHEKKESSIIDK